MKILNFSHPLSPETLTELAELYGEKMDVILVPVQIDFDGDLVQQLAALTRRIDEEQPDLVVLPSLSIAAGWVGMHLGQMADRPGIILVKKADPKAPFPKWVLAEVI